MFGQEKYNRAKDYSVPYMWGTVGIIYNKDVVKYGKNRDFSKK